MPRVLPPGRRSIRVPGARIELRLVVVISVLLAACGNGADVTTSPPTAAITVLSVVSTSVSTGVPTMTTIPSGHPADASWEATAVVWPVSPQCCDQPAIAPVSPPIVLPATDPAAGLEGLADGFYDVTVTRPGDPPGVVVLVISPWVSCSDTPDRCPPDPPENGVVGDAAHSITRTVFLSDSLDVVLRAIDDPASTDRTTLSGSGWSLYELLDGSWCGGYLESPLDENCGMSTAVVDWMWDPYFAGSSIEEIRDEIQRRGRDESFPFRAFSHDPGLPDCEPERGCLIGYRAPHDTLLVIDPNLVASGTWPGSHLFGWWASLEIREGRPILYLDAAQIAG